MPPTITELAARLDRETEDRERGMKYAHHMMEDIKTAFADFRVSVGRIEGGFNAHVIEDKKTSEVIDKVYTDIKNLTRLVYIGVGGVVVIGSVTAILGKRILEILSGH